MSEEIEVTMISKVSGELEMAILPQYIVLMNAGEYLYLEYTEKSESFQVNVGFMGNSVFEPKVKLEVVPPEGDGVAGVHIRCCSNGKYLKEIHVPGIRRTYISAAADEPEEDSSKPSCTLFEVFTAPPGTPQEQQQGRQVSFRSPYRKKHDQYGRCWVGLDYGGFAEGLHGIMKLDVEYVVPQTFTVIDWESLVKMPPIVSFKSLKNKNPASVQWSDSVHCWVMMFTPYDENHVNAVFRVKQIGNGNIALRSMPEDSLWLNATTRKASNHWKIIWNFLEAKWSATHDLSNEEHSEAWFRPIRVAGDDDDGHDENTKNTNTTIVLKCVKSGNICSIESDDSFRERPLHNFFMFPKSYIVKSSRLKVVDRSIITRKITNVRYQLDKAIVYNGAPTTMQTVLTVNNGSEEATQTVGFDYKKNYSTQWMSGLSNSSGIKTEFDFGIPKVSELGKVQVSHNYQAGEKYEWGEEEFHSEGFQTKHSVIVPPNSSVRVHATETRGRCYVPFTYTQQDVLVDQTNDSQEKDDGFFVGVNSHTLTFIVDAAEPIKEIPPMLKRLLSPAAAAIAPDSGSPAAC